MNNSNFSIEERQSFSEMYDIILFLDDDLTNKIPKKFIDFLEKARQKDYVSSINPYIPLKYQSLKKDTQLMISYIYSRYIEK